MIDSQISSRVAQSGQGISRNRLEEATSAAAASGENFAKRLQESVQQQDQANRQVDEQKAQVAARARTSDARPNNDMEEGPNTPAANNQGSSGTDANSTDVARPPAPESPESSRSNPADGSSSAAPPLPTEGDIAAVDGSLAWTALSKANPESPTSQVKSPSVPEDTRSREDTALTSDKDPSGPVVALPVHTLAPRIATGAGSVATVGGRHEAGIDESLPLQASRLAQDVRSPRVDIAGKPALDPAHLGSAAAPMWTEQFARTIGLGPSPLQASNDLVSPGMALGAPSASLLPAAMSLAPPIPLNSAPGTPEFTQNLGAEVMMMARNGIESATLTLNPADLGPIQIDLQMIKEVADVTFSVTHAMTRDAIEQSLPKLGEMLASQGLSLGNAQVGGENASNRQPAGQENSHANTPGNWQAPNNRDSHAGHTVDRRILRSMAASARGGVDLYA